jgi:small acid-soluble spore protein I (minor)
LENIDLRQAILNRVQNNSREQLNEVIEGSVGHDERALPGLGVLFEMIWKETGDTDHNHMDDTLYQHLHNKQG